MNTKTSTVSELKKDLETSIGCIDGEEIILIAINNKEHYISFKDLFNKGFFKMYGYNVEIKESGKSKYIDLRNVDIKIYDEKYEYVKLKTLIKNENETDWYDLQFADGDITTLTGDHQLPVIKNNKIEIVKVKDIMIGDYVINKCYGSGNSLIEIIYKKKLGFLTMDSYNVETESGYFTIFEEIYDSDYGYESKLYSYNCRTYLDDNLTK